MSDMAAETITAPGLDKLAEALAAFQAEMPTVPKSHTATVKSDKGSYSYTYAGLADVSEAAMPLLSKNGLSFSCLPGAGVLTGMLLHSSGQSLSASLPINGSTPQQVGSSLTYMRRYLLGCLTGLVTDDDDDGQLAQTAKRPPRAAKTAAPAPKKADTGEAMSETTRKRMFAMFTERKIEDRDKQVSGIEYIIGRKIASRGELTEAEAAAVIATLKAHQAADEAGEPA